MKRHSRAAALAAVLTALTLSMSACSTASDGTTGSPESSEAASSPTPTVPDGYALTEVPGTGLSIAIPSSWETLTAENSSDDALVERIAQARGMAPEALTMRLEDSQLISVDTSDTTDYAENITAMQDTEEELDGLPSEEEFTEEFLSDREIDSGEYARVTTGSGADAVRFVFTATGADGQKHHASLVLLETGEHTFFAVAVDAASTSRAQELADAVIGSL
ncbi:Prokaryotic membrane lipoprotein lipid attachment site profile [Propionibacterium ruminifibrarum]|uniref:Prokaryotic membrane lipoprotein lipid attachment site profile n=1 Tax=Propionibacterium ruminifibrarum TaxID=1962131 RepID=A0A375I4U5_9ACTN|nr:hypothetical protein [Propionibacterium ruminifibrarum]SPF68385.1 Prokaryotic membrane lipoprotein lipid attachment site profile [Propionibacterium ruminifibrarum]